MGMRIFWLSALLFVLCSSSAALAQSREDAMAAVLRCTGISDNAVRLACYDRAAGQTRSALAKPEIVAPPPPAATNDEDTDGAGHWLDKTFGTVPDRAPQTSVAQFGSETLTSRFAQPGHIRGDTINVIHARMTRYAFAGGMITVWLDNGQVWRQIPGGDALGSLSRPALSYNVEIARSWGGAYVMTIGGVHHKLNVLRIK
jgi:hypothetical protein